MGRSEGAVGRVCWGRGGARAIRDGVYKGLFTVLLFWILLQCGRADGPLRQTCYCLAIKTALWAVEAAIMLKD